MYSHCIASWDLSREEIGLEIEALNVCCVVKFTQSYLVVATQSNRGLLGEFKFPSFFWSSTMCAHWKEMRFRKTCLCVPCVAFWLTSMCKHLWQNAPWCQIVDKYLACNAQRIHYEATQLSGTTAKLQAQNECSCSKGLQPLTLSWSRTKQTRVQGLSWNGVSSETRKIWISAGDVPLSLSILTSRLKCDNNRSGVNQGTSTYSYIR